MRAVQIDSFGGPDVLRVVSDAPVPVPAADEVLVRVIAAGVNPLDYKIRDGSSGWVKTLPPEPFPIILGRECCGEVVAVGDRVDQHSVGDRVFGMAPFSHTGCYAEFVALPADCLAPAPADLDPVLLGGTALVGLTAWVATVDLGRVGAGDIVVVQGGSGGVGSLVVQLAVSAGATVYATTSARNAERVRSYGAIPVDYDTEDVRAVAPPADLVVDAVYFGTYDSSMDVLRPGGRLVVLPSLADLRPARERGIDVAIPALPNDTGRMVQLAERVAAGALRIEVAAVLPLAEVAEAHRLVETGHAGGKVILTL